MMKKFLRRNLSKSERNRYTVMKVVSGLNKIIKLYKIDKKEAARLIVKAKKHVS